MIYCNKCGHGIPEESLFCSKCGEKINKMIVGEMKDTPSTTPINKGKQDTQLKDAISTGVWGCLVPIIILFVILGSCSSNSTPDKDFKDITNKEMNDFLKWQDKEQKKKHDNEKFFND